MLHTVSNIQPPKLDQEKQNWVFNKNWGGKTKDRRIRKVCSKVLLRSPWNMEEKPFRHGCCFQRPWRIGMACASRRGPKRWPPWGLVVGAAKPPGWSNALLSGTQLNSTDSLEMDQQSRNWQRVSGSHGHSS